MKLTLAFFALMLWWEARGLGRRDVDPPVVKVPPVAEPPARRVHGAMRAPGDPPFDADP